MGFLPEWFLILPFRILEFVLFVPLRFFFKGKLSKKRDADIGLPGFVEACIQKGITSPDKIALGWIEAHPQEVLASSLKEVHDSRSKKVKMLLSELEFTETR